MMVDLNQRAAGIAQIYFENVSSARAEVVKLEAEEKCYVVNNCPSKVDPLLTERQLAAFRLKLSALDIEELGFAQYPRTGRQNAYSYAMIVGPVDHETTTLVREAYQQAITETE